MKVEKDTLGLPAIYVLHSGKKVYANRLILGINPKGEVFEGYDGSLGQADDFTPAERREIAEHAIDLWSLWGDVSVLLDRSCPHANDPYTCDKSACRKKRGEP